MVFPIIVTLVGSAVSAMADWAGFSIVQNLVSTAYSFLTNHMLPDNTVAELRRLQTVVPQITSVMGIAEALQMKHPDAGQWVERFRQALEASEDVLDEFEYNKLEDMVKNKDEASGSAASSSKKRKLSPINKDTLERLKEAITMVDQAATETERLLRLATELGIKDISESWQEACKVLRRGSTFLLVEREVFGRDIEKDKIIGWLKRPTLAQLSTFGIVGVGGVGKTTLVQFAYQEICRSNHFDQTIWISVSTNFSVEDIMRKMLDELDTSRYSGKLQETLIKKILSKKILLVLDDIWDDERRSDWEQLVAPLRFVHQGSKIIFTTRMQSVADLLVSVISTEHESLTLRGLGEDQLQRLFYSYAFNGFNPNDHRDLQIFGDRILKMLRGSPLVAKVIGSLLNSHMDNHYLWRRISNGNSIFNLEEAKDVVEVLKLSYYNLPKYLQICFRFCSIFPQDHKFDKNELIKMWMAVGIISQGLCKDKQPEDIGEMYFNLLLRKSFFESGKDEGYVMNDLMHELAQNVSIGECCRIDYNDKSITIPSTVRHVSVHESEIEKVFHLENLRSLVITTSMEENGTEVKLFVLPNNLIKRSLRLLKICESRCCELPEEISCLVHLRYLSIGLNDTSQLFKYSNIASIYKLYHLLVLEFLSYSRIETTEITNLLRLRYMNIPWEIMQTIRGVHKLTSLQELHFFVGQESGHRINELGTLNDLRRLTIERIENIADPAEAKSANLLGKNNLMSLFLKWTSMSNPDNPEQIIDCLQPHPNLMELRVENYRGQRSPNWMDESPLLKISSLKLYSCPNWKDQVLSWQMPYLKILYIYKCASLDRLPNMPLSLIEFGIIYVGLTSLPNFYQSFRENNPGPLPLKSSLRVVQIQRCFKLISLDGFLQQYNIDFQSIENIGVIDCENLSHIPIDAFGKFVSLKKLIIRDCPMLVAAINQRNLLPLRLEYLEIENCGELDVPLLELASGLNNLTNLSIKNCANISHIPSSENVFQSLSHLIIIGCDKLIEHLSSKQAQGVNQGSNWASLKLSHLEIDHLYFLIMEPLRSLSYVSHLKVLHCSGMDALPEQWLLQNLNTLKELTILNASSLRSLPKTMARLTALELLKINEADLLEELPELPASLKEKCIEGRRVTFQLEMFSQSCFSENAFASLGSQIIDGCDKLVEHSLGKQAHGVLTNADWAGSSVVENFVSTAYSYLGDRMLLADSEAKLKRLNRALPQIRVVMGIAEALKMKDPSTGLWVDQFRQAVEAAEDMLDELEYKKLEDMVKNQDKAGGYPSSSKKRKLSALNDDTLERLKEIVKILDQAADRVKALLQTAIVLGIHDISESEHEAGQILRWETEKEIFGREVEKDKIIDWLKRPTDAHLSSFGIVGVGGLGKTTLVQFAYQEMCKSNHFDKTIWVCVSTNFSVEDITRKMLCELGENNCYNKPLNALQETLKENIQLKKILLVLDDIWDDERMSDWDQLVAPLRFLQEGSKIIFTTRMKSVADLLASVISAEHESLSLQGLGEQELQLLFHSYAFCGFNLDNHGDLQAIGDQILKMLQGSPLAAKVIGSLLNSRMNHQYWRTVLNHGSLFNLEQAKDVVEVLKLSYYHLPANLQVCFRFCSIFSQDHKFDKDELIKMWIASGFIRQQLHSEERPEDIGEYYFNHLLRKSFFEYSKSREGERYVMHDLVHELARDVSIGECCRIQPNDNSVTIPSTVRHVFVNECEIRKVSHLDNLRSLVITTYMEKIETDMDLFVIPNSLIKKPLRLLKICGSKYCELPEEISYLVHLRYLSIELDYKTRYFKCLLPASIYKLYHLQVLELPNDGDYSGIETAKMTNLVSLRHMRLPKQIMETINGIHKLTSLQELTFIVGQESGHCINELGEVNNLRHLSIKGIENIGDPFEAKSANLLAKNNLTSLSLKWTSESNHDNPEQIIDCLQPHPNLMELTIENYMGQRCPSWMGDSPLLNLSSLKLLNCPLWKNQLFSGKIPYLKILDVRDCLNLDNLPDMPLSLIEFRISNVGLTSLPALYQNYGNNTPAPLSLKSLLRVVEIKRCPNLISLHGFLQQDNLDLQAIEEFIINGCEKLVLAPVEFGKLLSLKHLSIQNVGVSAPPDYYQSSDSRDDPSTSSLQSSLREVEIRNYPKLTALNELFSWQMPCLEVLYIYNCVSLDKLPDMPLSLIEFQISNVGLTSLPCLFQSSSNSSLTSLSLKSSLRVVQIERCPNLICLNGFLLQSNLDLQAIVELTINACERLVHLPTHGFGNLTSLIYLTIYGCPKLVAVDNHTNLLPTKLKKLSIENCGKLDVPLLQSASRLVTLTDLSINNCENITQIPSSEFAFGSLNELCICGCKKLVDHSYREQSHGADQGSSLALLKLSRLEIDHLSLLLSEPLRSLRSVSYLRVWYCSGMETLPKQWFLQNSNTLCWLSIRNASTLKSLPATFFRLTSLEWLEIWQADLLRELPELPASLRSLVIRDASSLRSLPAMMARLSALERLEILKADLLEELPELPASLKEKYIEGRGVTSQFGTFPQSYLSLAQV